MFHCRPLIKYMQILFYYLYTFQNFAVTGGSNSSIFKDDRRRKVMKNWCPDALLSSFFYNEIFLTIINNHETSCQWRNVRWFGSYHSNVTILIDIGNRISSLFTVWCRRFSRYVMMYHVIIHVHIVVYSWCIVRTNSFFNNNIPTG